MRSKTSTTPTGPRRDIDPIRWHRKPMFRHTASGLMLSLLLACTPATAQDKARAYDKDLLRLSELLGAVHYLRELCAAGDGARWRNEMEALIEAEGTSDFRRVTLTKRFNKGYRSFQRTYRSCTNTALTAIDRFVGEGAEIAKRLTEKKS